jgi:hypothetical protein
MTQNEVRRCQLTPQELRRLDYACRSIFRAFDNPSLTRERSADPEWKVNLHHPARIYLVGSVNERPDFRDIDVRCMLPDPVYEALTGCAPDADDFDRAQCQRLHVLNIAFTDMLERACPMRKPIDFQFQSITEGNAIEGGTSRNPLGMEHR